MKTMYLKGALVLLWGLLTANGAEAQRIRENFDCNWQFHKGDIAIGRAVKAGSYGGLTDANVKVVRDSTITIAYNDRDKAAPYNPADWRTLDLPHDWCVEGKFVNDGSKVIDGAPKGLVSHGFLPVGIGFYRKEFAIPAEDLGKKISIEFDGIFRNSTVWVNGYLMGHHESGYIPSHYDLTDVLRYGNEGKNVILVKVDASEFEGWWYEGAGIYRHVWLTKTDPLHVGRYGTFVTTPSINENEAEVNVETVIENESASKRKVSVRTTVLNPSRHAVASISKVLDVKPLANIGTRNVLKVNKPELWSPESPALYKLHTEVFENEVLIDETYTNFGIRDVEYRLDGFYLNGQPYQIKGTANHQDFAGVGVAIPDNLNRYRVKLLKEMGSNAWRCAHNPPSPELLDICDEMGMLVLDENRLLSSSENGKKDVTTLIKRDRNHPCVFMWCVENEETIEGSPQGKRLLNTLINLVKSLDPTRPVTAAINHGWNSNGYTDNLDVVGYNYGHRGSQYAKDKTLYPSRKAFVTETTSFVATRGEYEDNFDKAYVSNKGNGVGWGLLPGKDWEEIVKYPWLGGMFAWTGFDYRGEPTPVYRWPSVLSHFGIMDLCGFPKDGYYAYKAAWNNAPLVHVFPHWNWQGKEGMPITVMGYTNCDEIELILNGKSKGKKKCTPYERLEWDVNYQPGTLKAIGYIKGKKVTSQTIKTTSSPYRIAACSNVKDIKADCEDIAVINISVVDKDGLTVPTADNEIFFEVTGPAKIIGTGNGNPSSLEPDKASQRRAFNGKCQVILQSLSDDGEGTLKCSSPGLIQSQTLIMSKRSI